MKHGCARIEAKRWQENGGRKMQAEDEMISSMILLSLFCLMVDPASASTDDNATGSPLLSSLP